MNTEEIRDYCLSKNEVSESFPFDDTALVFKVLDKMFALVILSDDSRMNLKCNPELALELREKYPCVIPGYHMNKKHWNTIVLDGSVKRELLKEWIDHSYDTVVNGMTKSKKALLGYK